MTTNPIKKPVLVNLLTSLKVNKGDNGGVTDEQIKKINSMKFNGPKKTLSKDDVYVRSMIIMGEEPTTKMSIHPEGVLNGKTIKIQSQLSKDLPGAPMLIGHNFDTAPWGRIFDSQVLKGDDGYDGNVVKIWYYFLKNSEGKVIADKIDSGIYSEGSISYNFSKPLCSICHGRIGYSWYEDKGRRCTEHQIGEKYIVDGVEQTCYYYPSKITKVLEVSFVFRGAYEKTQANYVEKFSDDVKLGLDAMEQLLSEQSITDEQFNLDNQESESTNDCTSGNENNSENDENGGEYDGQENNSESEDNEETSGNSEEQSGDIESGDSSGQEESYGDGNDSESLNNTQSAPSSNNSITQLSFPGVLIVGKDGSRVFRFNDLVLEKSTDNSTAEKSDAAVSDSSTESFNEVLDEILDENKDDNSSESCDDSDISTNFDNDENVDSIEIESTSKYSLKKAVLNSGESFYILVLSDSESSRTFFLFDELSKSLSIQATESLSNDLYLDAKISEIDSGSFSFERKLPSFEELILSDGEFSGRYYISKSVINLSSSYSCLIQPNKLRDGIIHLITCAKNQERSSEDIYGVDSYPKINYNRVNGCVFFDLVE